MPSSSNPSGPGLLTATFNGHRLGDSFLDTGSEAYYFADASIPDCTQPAFAGFFCPASPLDLSPTLTGTSNVTVSAAFTLFNPTGLGAAINVAPGVGIDSASGNTSFDFGIPFYFGRTVYTAIEGLNAGGTEAPTWRSEGRGSPILTNPA